MYTRSTLSSIKHCPFSQQSFLLEPCEDSPFSLLTHTLQQVVIHSPTDLSPMSNDTFQNHPGTNLGKRVWPLHFKKSTLALLSGTFVMKWEVCKCQCHALWLLWTRPQQARKTKIPLQSRTTVCWADNNIGIPTSKKPKG